METLEAETAEERKESWYSFFFLSFRIFYSRVRRDMTFKSIYFYFEQMQLWQLTDTKLVTQIQNKTKLIIMKIHFNIVNEEF